MAATDSKGNLIAQRYCVFGRWGNGLSQADISEVLAYGRIGISPPANERDRAIRTTILGTQLLKLLDQWAGALVYSEARFALQVQSTRQYLMRLPDAASALDSRLLVLVIP